MTQIEKYLREAYRFCDNSEQVNWDARRKIDLTFYRERVLPAAYAFCEKSIKRTTFSRNRMHALIGLSGGLDSTIASYIVAQAMQQSVMQGRTREANLTLLSFIGLEDSDTKSIAEDLQNRFKDIDVQYEETAITKQRDAVLSVIHDLTMRLGRKSLKVPGELTTRVICSIINELGTRTNACAIDTTNSTEVILGEFSIGLGYDCSLLYDLYKSSVFAIGEILAIPQTVMRARPINSAFSFTTKPNLYFGEIPNHVSARQVYEVLDPILYWLYKRKKSPAEIAQRLGHAEAVIKRVKRRIRRQKYRRITPLFCIEANRIFYPNSTDISDKESRKIIEESMLGDLFATHEI